MSAVVFVKVSVELFTQMITKGYKSGGIECIEGLPKGAEFLSIGMPQQNTIELIYEVDNGEDRDIEVVMRKGE